MSAIYTAVHALLAEGVNVLSPADPQVVDFCGDFLFVASDRIRSVKLVQDRHFEAIRASDFLWLVCPDGYVGVSTSAEIGAAYTAGTPIISDHLPLDPTLQHYVKKVASISSYVRKLRKLNVPEEKADLHLLLDPGQAVEKSIEDLQSLRSILDGRTSLKPAELSKEVKRNISEHIERVSFGSL